MIYTLTLCPAVDLYINKTTNYCLPGGKGINVSKLLKSLKTKSVCLGFVGGKTGKFITTQLDKENIKHDFVATNNPTRICMKIFLDKEVEINGKQLPISKQEYKSLKQKLLKLTSKDILIVSGSLPKDLDVGCAKKVLDLLFKKKVKFVFDTSDKLLLRLCKYKPFVIKPNIDELSYLFNTKITNEKQVIQYATKLNNLGAKNVLVSLGSKGAILVSNKKVFKSKAPKRKLISSVGCGDSALAGFVYKYLKTNNLNESLIFSVACGSAKAFCEKIPNLNNIIILFKKIKKSQK